jgi:hypothetical protein
MTAVSVACGVCPGVIELGAAACPGCGRPLTDQDRAVLQVRLEGGEFVAHERGRKMRDGSKWIGMLAILFAVSAPIVFAMQKTEADKALSQLSAFDDDAPLAPIDGKTYTAGELRKEVMREPIQLLIGNLILAVLMGVLWFWSRRAPLASIACALALFLVVQLVSAVIDPSSIMKGLLIKIFAVAALGKGLKAALAAREAMRRPAA